VTARPAPHPWCIKRAGWAVLAVVVLAGVCNAGDTTAPPAQPVSVAEGGDMSPELEALRVAVDELIGLAGNGGGGFDLWGIRRLRLVWTHPMTLDEYEAVARVVGDWFYDRGCGVACVDGLTSHGAVTGASSITIWWRAKSSPNVDPFYDLVATFRLGQAVIVPPFAIEPIDGDRRF
jgi:hypothetical protein